MTSIPLSLHDMNQKVDIQVEEGDIEEVKRPEDTIEEFVVDPIMERRLLWKIDLRLVPMCVIMYMLNYLDRNNIGNAKTAGMQTDLKLSSSDYSLAVSIFFIGYLVFQVPSNLILSKTRPRFYLPGIMFVWGCIVIGYLGVNTFHGLLGVRVVLGVVESGFFPGVLIYMSMWYRRAELARRFSIFYTASLLAGAFGGLLAGAIVTHLDGTHGIPAWKWLFLIEGLITVCFASVAVFIMPDFPSNTKWLSDAERKYAVARLAAERTVTVGAEESIGLWKSAKLAVLDWKMWLFTFGQSTNTCAGTITYFIPTLVGSLGYSGNMAQYMTVPIYCVAIVVVLSVCFSSDFHQERPKHLMFITLLSVVSLSIVAGVQNPKVRYAFLAFGAAGTWCCGPMTLVYTSNSLTGSAEVRAIQIGILNGLSNLSSAYGSYIWPANSAPQYIPGFVTSVMLQVGTFAFSVIGWFVIKGNGGRRPVAA